MSNYSEYVKSLSPVAWWRFNDAEGTTTSVDETGNNSFTTPTFIVKDIKGLITSDEDKCYHFTGQPAQEIVFTNFPISPTADFTINVHLKTTTAYFSIAIDSGNYHLLVDSGGLPTVYKDGTGTNIKATTAINDDVHHMVTYVNKADGTAELYIDGVLEASNTTFGLPASSLDKLFSSTQAENNNIFGKVDEISFYHSALTATQIADLWTFATENPSYTIDYTINESVPQDQWDVCVYHLADKTLSATQRVLNGTNTITLTGLNKYAEPQMMTVVPYQGDIWTAGITVAVGDLVFPTDPVTTPYYYRCTAGGTTGTTEPTWPTSTGSSVTDGTATWEFVGALVQPILHSPIIPVKV